MSQPVAPRPPRTLHAPADLAEHGLIPRADLAKAEAVARRYAVAVSPAVAALIDRSDPADPIARQYIPDARELETTPEERADPIGDAAHSPLPGIVHRYPDRVLLKVTGLCPVYCRFCFRREMVGPALGPSLTAAQLQAAVDYIRDRPEVFEAIVTGGDPLVLSPRRIREVAIALDGVASLAVIRWHTRLPVVAPERVTANLVDALRPRRAAVYVAIHANHPRELTAEAVAAVRRLASAGIALVSQTVLLKGVNDSADTLAALMRAFVAAGVKPYYLHHADLAPGTAHLRTTIEQGQAIMRELRGRISGLCQPTYVLDIPGGAGKVPVGPGYLSDGVGGTLSVEDYRGGRHSYPPDL